MHNPTAKHNSKHKKEVVPHAANPTTNKRSTESYATNLEKTKRGLGGGAVTRRMFFDYGEEKSRMHRLSAKPLGQVPKPSMRQVFTCSRPCWRE